MFAVRFPLFFLPLFLFSSFPAPAQTFTGAGGPIPDDGTVITFPIQVSGLPALDTVGFGIESVCLNAIHTWNADLSVALRAPDGTFVPLFSGIGGDTDGFQNTCLSGNAAQPVFNAWFPFTGQFRPAGDMGTLNNGQDPNGTWELVILDTYAFADAGELFDWSITFGSQPCLPFPFASSDLPIVMITTGGQAIPDEPKIDAVMTVLDNGPGQRNYVDQTVFAYQGPVGVELHGNSTQALFPKKSMKVETRDSLGDDLDVGLLGLPPTSDFVLTANYSDKTFLRNALTYELARQTGHYAPRTRFCEVLVDRTYQGVYVLTEKIKRGSERVDIARLTASDTAGVELTGGYIVAIDWNTSPGWTSPFVQPASLNQYTYFQHEYPRPEDILPEQSAYIRRFVDSFEVSLDGAGFQDTVAGWRGFAAEKSFLDFMLLNEVSKNVDGYRLSTYFYKDRDDRDRRLHMGPAWDFDLAWYNADYCEGFLHTGWAYNFNYVCVDGVEIPFWWERLMEDSLFARNLACRWQSLRQGAMHKDHIFALIDSMAAVVDEAQQRNFSYWPTLGAYVWPNPGPLPSTYAGEIQKMKNWIAPRLAWMDLALAPLAPDLDQPFQAEALSALQWQFTAGANGPGYSFAWDFGDGAVSQEAAPMHQFSQPGTYTVALTVATPFGCSHTTEQIVHIVNTTSGEPEQSGGWRCWPNPVQDFLHLEGIAGTGRQDVELELVNSLGKTVRRERIESGRAAHRLALTGLPAGFYTLMVRDGRGPWVLPVLVVIGQD